MTNVQPLPAYQPHPDVLVQPMSHSTILLHLTTNCFYELNATGSRFWELLEQGKHPHEIQEQMLREYNVSPAGLTGEIEQLLQELKQSRLITVARSPVA